MRARKPSASSVPVDIARFELFLNVFVRTSDQDARKGRRKRWRGQIARAK